MVSAPVGILYTPDEIDRLIEVVNKYKENGKLVSTVGDRVTYTLLSNGVIPDVAVIDGMEMRTRVSLVDMDVFNLIVYVENKRGYVNLAIAEVLNEVLNERPILIYVEGEEDLVGFPVVLALPIGSCMLYGQPRKGIVLVNIEESVKERAKSLLNLES